MRKVSPSIGYGRYRRYGRYVWAAPTTLLGCLVVLVGLRRAKLRVVDGVLEAHGPTLAWLLSHLAVMPGGPAAALTLGHVVIAQDDEWLELTRAHERVHVRQCEAWGPLFVPAYLAASLWAFLRGRNVYFDNRFEVEAFDGTGPSGRRRRKDQGNTVHAVAKTGGFRAIVEDVPQMAAATTAMHGGSDLAERRSLVVPTALSSGTQKLGQPVPLSNFELDENSGRRHPAHANVPRRFSWSSGLLNGGSVSSRRRTANWSGVRSFRHSASVCVTSKSAPIVRRTAATAATSPAPPAMRRRLVIISR